MHTGLPPTLTLVSVLPQMGVFHSCSEHRAIHDAHQGLRPLKKISRRACTPGPASTALSSTTSQEPWLGSPPPSSRGPCWGRCIGCATVTSSSQCSRHPTCMITVVPCLPPSLAPSSSNDWGLLAKSQSLVITLQLPSVLQLLVQGNASTNIQMLTSMCQY